MKKETQMKGRGIVFSEENIKSKIFTIRNIQVMLDRDLAVLYEVPTKALNQAVKRNIERFPLDFMFQLTEAEKDELVTNCDHLQKLKYSPQLPFAFTEHGIITLSGILKSKRAIEVNQKLLEHDTKFQQIFKLIEDKSIKPEKGIFYDGQIFDAYKFISDLIRSAKRSIILIDNYIDESVLVLFSSLHFRSLIKMV